MQRFFVSASLMLDQIVNLETNTINHLRSLRIRNNELITLFNGDGYDYVANVLLFKKREAQAQIINKLLINNESNLNLTMMVSMIANDKLDLIIQKCVELGVNNFVPLYTQNAKHLNCEKLAIRIKHWQNIIYAASEQSRRAKLMLIQAPLKYTDAIANINSELNLILNPYQPTPTFNLPITTSSISVVIGPEGGLTDLELDLARARGFYSLNLGPRIMRTETATIVVAGIIQAKYGDFT